MVDVTDHRRSQRDSLIVSTAQGYPPAIFDASQTVFGRLRTLFLPFFGSKSTHKDVERVCEKPDACLEVSNVKKSMEK